MNTFGQVVKTLRTLEDLTLERVAKRIGSHKGYVSGIENHKVNPPSVGIVRKYAKLFTDALRRRGVEATDVDWVELAWGSKAPPLIRARIAARLLQGNPLAVMELGGMAIVPVKPKDMQAEQVPQATQEVGTAAPLGAQR